MVLDPYIVLGRECFVLSENSSEPVRVSGRRQAARRTKQPERLISYYTFIGCAYHSLIEMRVYTCMRVKDSFPSVPRTRAVNPLKRLPRGVNARPRFSGTPVGVSRYVSPDSRGFAFYSKNPSVLC